MFNTRNQEPNLLYKIISDRFVQKYEFQHFNGHKPTDSLQVCTFLKCEISVPYTVQIAVKVLTHFSVLNLSETLTRYRQQTSIFSSFYNVLISSTKINLNNIILIFLKKEFVKKCRLIIELKLIINQKCLALLKKDPIKIQFKNWTILFIKKLLLDSCVLILKKYVSMNDYIIHEYYKYECKLHCIACMNLIKIKINRLT